MPDCLGELLTSLEEVTAKALGLSEPALGLGADLPETLVLIRQRDALIRGLCEMLPGRDLSYVEYNRTLILSYQGQRLQDQLSDVRTLLATSLAAAMHQRAYAERVSGTVIGEPIPQHIQIG